VKKVAEYIDREALEKAMTIAAVNGKDKDRRTWAKAICVLHDMPTADVVPVVRCKDCKHGFFHNSSGGMYWCTSPAGLLLQTPNAFCCYGEKKEGEENG
jgi:hypothetical protein